MDVVPILHGQQENRLGTTPAQEEGDEVSSVNGDSIADVDMTVGLIRQLG